MEYARNAATGDTRDMPVAQPDMSQELRPQRLVQRDSNDDLTLSTNRVVKNQIVFRVRDARRPAPRTRKPVAVEQDGASAEQAFHSRRPHRKSRTGCGNCKKRRVKVRGCDTYPDKEISLEYPAMPQRHVPLAFTFFACAHWSLTLLRVLRHLVRLCGGPAARAAASPPAGRPPYIDGQPNGDDILHVRHRHGQPHPTGASVKPELQLGSRPAAAVHDFRRADGLVPFCARGATRRFYVRHVEKRVHRGHAPARISDAASHACRAWSGVYVSVSVRRGESAAATGGSVPLAERHQAVQARAAKPHQHPQYGCAHVDVHADGSAVLFGKGVQPSELVGVLVAAHGPELAAGAGRAAVPYRIGDSMATTEHMVGLLPGSRRRAQDVRRPPGRVRGAAAGPGTAVRHRGDDNGGDQPIPLGAATASAATAAAAGARTLLQVHVVHGAATAGLHHAAAAQGRARVPDPVVLDGQDVRAAALVDRPARARRVHGAVHVSGALPGP
ncbi:hypothetical protein LOZ40_006757 [Ophidiomyces ophidiicola]|nr:hypothetical protein LOZ40_006757 [Ophidiomyces ophidiicola]